MSAIGVEGLTFGFHRPLFENFSFTAERGECIAITGPSGSGKSTLAWILAGIIPRSLDYSYEGSVELFGKNVLDYSVAELSQCIGIVFQNPDAQLFSPTVFDEVAFGPENLCLPREEILQRIEGALCEVGMQEHIHSEIETLSGGQKQLIALASVLALHPKILLFDEVFSFLDDQASEQVREVMKRLISQERTILFIDHNEENLPLASRVIQLGGLHE